MAGYAPINNKKDIFVRNIHDDSLVFPVRKLNSHSITSHQDKLQNGIQQNANLSIYYQLYREVRRIEHQEAANFH